MSWICLTWTPWPLSSWFSVMANFSTAFYVCRQITRLLVHFASARVNYSFIFGWSCSFWFQQHFNGLSSLKIEVTGENWKFSSITPRLSTSQIFTISVPQKFFGHISAKKWCFVKNLYCKTWFGACSSIQVSLEISHWRSVERWGVKVQRKPIPPKKVCKSFASEFISS